MELLNTISNNRTWNRHGLKIVYAVAVLLCLLIIASISWNVYSQSKLKSANYAPQQIAPIVRSTKQSYRINDIVQANLFGNPNPAPVKKVITKTTLDLTLQGILSATDEKMARAIIRSGKKKSELYSVGENIKGAGVSIEEIKISEVLINRNGAIESLPLNTKSSKLTNSLISYNSQGSSGTLSQSNSYSPASTTGRSTPKKRSPNGQRRAIKKPNFSGLDRALKKMSEI
jgi:type II secretory pathway component PulC